MASPLVILFPIVSSNCFLWVKVGPIHRWERIGDSVGFEFHPVENVAAYVDTVRNFDQRKALWLDAEDRTLRDGQCCLSAVFYARANGVGDLFGAAHKLMNCAFLEYAKLSSGGLRFEAARSK